MNIPSQTRICTDCGSRLHQIRLLDATQPGLFNDGCLEIDLGYSAPDAKPPLLSKKIPKSGTLMGLMCEGCHRVYFYARGGLPTGK